MRGLGRLRYWQSQWQKNQTRMRKALWQRVHNPDGRSRPVFLVGCGRSGTSMLVWQLDKLWQVELFNENHPAAFDQFRLRPLSVIDTLIEQSHAPLVVFKPILDTCQTRNLLNRYPDARVIFAFRHYDDVINSSLKKFGIENRINHVRRWMADDFGEFAVAPPPEQTKAYIRSRWHADRTPEEGAAIYWLFYNRLYFDLQLDQNPRVRLVQYEKLVTEPHREFRRLAQFLEIPFTERLVEGVFASSVGRNPAPQIDGQLRADCEALYQQLSERVVMETAVPQPA
ncbi:MAG: hypothetical protein D6706_00495 [Chloroflexi bacterium]|nr:MAG: hypothetical protein D6706_00495 [Chloroflexota bacterium]